MSWELGAVNVKAIKNLASIPSSPRSWTFQVEGKDFEQFSWRFAFFYIS